jgi:dimethylhistidine N-methyltransferase
MMRSGQAERLRFYDNPLEAEDVGAELLDGLHRAQKVIPPKFFYDERGSELFTEITRQPEYYLTRTEIQLLKSLGSRLTQLAGEVGVLIEYGSGSSEKTRLLLEELRPRVYAPLDISRDYLAHAARALAAEFPWLEVHATCIDYTTRFNLPFVTEGSRLGFFPGSSIGNFGRPEAQLFLEHVAQQLGDEGALLIGVDMAKDIDVLNRAYNDARGVTAAFNRNVLVHLNRAFGADFNPELYEHQARYNEAEGCIQMFLVSTRAQIVNIAETQIKLREGESIHTENSHKYRVDEFEAMAVKAGFEVCERWYDPNQWFGMFFLRTARAGVVKVRPKPSAAGANSGTLRDP